MKLLWVLLLLISCEGGKGSSTSVVNNPPVVNPPIDPPNEPNLEPEIILLNYDESPKYTKLNSASFFAQSDKNFSLAKIYKGTDCSNGAFVRNATRYELSLGISVTLTNNQNNMFNVEIYDVNNLKSIECLTVANISNDTVSPTTLGMSTYLFNKNKNVNTLEFLVGGNITEDHPEPNQISKVVYYKLIESVQIKVNEFSVSDYNSKSIRLILSENEANLFYFSVIDIAGNESNKAGLLIVDHQNPNPSAPILTQELINTQNRYTDQINIVLKGIVGVTTQRIRVYNDSTKSVLIADESAASFEGLGIAVNLVNDSYNDFFIVAVKNSIESPGVSFGINQKTTAPRKPSLDSSIMQANNQTLEDDIEKYVAFFGTADADVSRINVYSDAARTNLLISYNSEDWSAGTGAVYLLSEGFNSLYFVSVDDVGRESLDSVYFNVTFDTSG